MKKYIKPIIEIKEFKAVERIADLNNFLNDNTDSGIDLAEGNITSYYATSA